MIIISIRDSIPIVMIFHSISWESSKPFNLKINNQLPPA